MTKRCPKCGQTLPVELFHKNKAGYDGIDSWCRDCKDAARKKRDKANPQKTRERSRRWRLANPEKSREHCRRWNRDNQGSERERNRRWREANKDKIREEQKQYRTEHRVENNARAILHRAVASGQLKRQPCEVCGATQNVHAHHDDYSKPLDVRWLCASHHQLVHNEMKRKEADND